MRIRQSVAVNPSIQSTVHSAVQSLFHPEFPITDVRCLPFVRDLHGKERRNHGGGRTFWSHLPSPSDESLTERGTLFAAAYLIFLKRNGEMSLPLTWILRDMDLKNDMVGVGFISYLQQHAWNHASLMTTGEIERSARKSLNNDRILVAREMEDVGVNRRSPACDELPPVITSVNPKPWMDGAFIGRYDETPVVFVSN